MKHATSTRWLDNPNWGCSHFPLNFWSSIGYVFKYQSDCSCAHDRSYIIIYVPPIKLTIELRIIVIFWTHGPISFEHMFICYMFLKPHQLTYNSNIGVRLRVVTTLGMSTLCSMWIGHKSTYHLCWRCNIFTLDSNTSTISTRSTKLEMTLFVLHNCQTRWGNF